MFYNFFYMLRDRGVPVSPTSLLRLQKALSLGLVRSLDDLYIAARSLLVKSEQYFDIYDQSFIEAFHKMEDLDPSAVKLNEVAESLRDEWLNDPEGLAEELGLSEEELNNMTFEELYQFFLDFLKEQAESHHAVENWIGTRNNSPVGALGFHPEVLRAGGGPGKRSAVMLAMDRRYLDYSQGGPLKASQIGEALKKLKRLTHTGPKDVVNINSTIYQTMKNAGEIEIIFDRRPVDRLKIKLMLDNGGWSMDRYVEIVQTLFHYARHQFRELEICYFHNTIYNTVWQDPQRINEPAPVEEFTRFDPETRLIIVGDASMSPYELENAHGASSTGQQVKKPSTEYLTFLAKTFRHCAWLNPVPMKVWEQTRTIQIIAGIIPMFELSLDGLDKAIHHLVLRN